MKKRLYCFFFAVGNIFFRKRLVLSDSPRSFEFRAINKTTRAYFFWDYLFHLGLITTIAIDRHSTKFPQNALFCRCWFRIVLFSGKHWVKLIVKNMRNNFWSPIFVLFYKNTNWDCLLYDSADERFHWSKQNVNTDGPKNDWLLTFDYLKTQTFLSRELDGECRTEC